MEEINSLQDAWEGDLIENKGKIYRVIDATYDVLLASKVLRAVRTSSLWNILFVKEFIV